MEYRKKTHFTPGPWRAFCERHGEWRVVIPLQAQDDGILLGWVELFPEGIASPRPEGDAYLISAAPEMYHWQEETLEVLQQICRNLNTDDGVRERLEPLIFKGEKIGKKARGEK